MTTPSIHKYTVQYIWYGKCTRIYKYIHTLMDERIGTPGTFPENAPFLPEKCCSYKCFGVHMFISFKCIGTTQKAEEKSQILHHFTQNFKNPLDKIIGTLKLTFRCTLFGENN